jgi:uncharacterized membrane protein
VVSNGTQHAPWLTTERLGAFTDGVIAIIITILVLEIQVPEGHDFAADGILAFLAKIERQVVVYMLSFALILTFWLQHHVIFHYLARTDRLFIFLNGLFLFLLSLAPFTTELAREYRGVPVAEAIFGITYCLSGVVLYLMWHYATRGARLLRKPIDDDVRRSMDRRILVAPALCLLGVFVMLLDFRLGSLVFLSIPCFYAKHWIADSSWRSDG